MSLQTVYSDNISAAIAGMLANEEPRVLISRTVEDAAGIAFGLAVMQGTADKGVVVSDGSSFLGVTVREQSVNPATPSKFAQYEEARIVTKGVIWVVNEGGVEAGEAAEALANGQLGPAVSDPIPGSRWETTAEDGQLAQLRLA